VQSNLTTGLKKDEVINLQFTRYVRRFIADSDNNLILAEQQARRKQSP